MKFLRISFLFVVAACFASFQHPGLGDEDGAVLTAAFDTIAPRGGALVLRDSSLVIRPDAPLLRHDAVWIALADSSLVRSFAERSRVSRPVPRLQPGRRPVEYVGRGKLPLAGVRDDYPVGSEGMREWYRKWQEWSARHRGAVGFHRVSAVGYSTNRQVAIVYIVHTCGLRCGSSRFVRLSREHGRWRATAVLTVSHV